VLLGGMAGDRENVRFGLADGFMAGYAQQTQKDLLDEVWNVGGIADSRAQELTQPAGVFSGQLRNERSSVVCPQVLPQSTLKALERTRG
jgi:hypothetical protein